MSHYVFAPAGAQKTQSGLIYRCVEYIGESQAGGGSNFAKGKRYLKSKIPHCSGRAIKRTISTFSKVVGNDFETYGCDVYYYHIVLCHKIVYAIIDYIKTYSNDQWKKDTFGHIPKESEYCNLIYQHRISQLRWVQHMDYMEQGERAAEVLGHFS